MKSVTVTTRTLQIETVFDCRFVIIETIVLSLIVSRELRMKMHF